MTAGATELVAFDRTFVALSRSVERLAATLTSLSPEQIRGPSYADDWTIAQVASHLGSAAEIFRSVIEAGVQREAPPERAHFEEVWDRWNAKSPDDQVADALRSDEALLAFLDSIPDHLQLRWRQHVFGAERGLNDIVRLRLSEHALHSWDIWVMFEPDATLAVDAVPIVLDGVAAVVARTAKPSPEDVRVAVSTTGPERRYLLGISADGASLTGDGDHGGTNAVLTLPAESFVRLVYGRLDPDHTPASVRAHGVELDTLRRVFPGP